jgi:hypothetical protein
VLRLSHLLHKRDAARCYQRLNGEAPWGEAPPTPQQHNHPPWARGPSAGRLRLEFAGGLPAASVRGAQGPPSPFVWVSGALGVDAQGLAHMLTEGNAQPQVLSLLRVGGSAPGVLLQTASAAAAQQVADFLGRRLGGAAASSSMPLWHQPAGPGPGGQQQQPPPSWVARGGPAGPGPGSVPVLGTGTGGSSYDPGGGGPAPRLGGGGSPPRVASSSGAPPPRPRGWSAPGGLSASWPRDRAGSGEWEGPARAEHGAPPLPPSDWGGGGPSSGGSGSGGPGAPPLPPTQPHGLGPGSQQQQAAMRPSADAPGGAARGAPPGWPPAPVLWRGRLSKSRTAVAALVCVDVAAPGAGARVEPFAWPEELAVLARVRIGEALEAYHAAPPGLRAVRVLLPAGGPGSADDAGLAGFMEYLRSKDRAGLVHLKRGPGVGHARELHLLLPDEPVLRGLGLGGAGGVPRPGERALIVVITPAARE